MMETVTEGSGVGVNSWYSIHILVLMVGLVFRGHFSSVVVESIAFCIGTS